MPEVEQFDAARINPAPYWRFEIAQEDVCCELFPEPADLVPLAWLASTRSCHALISMSPLRGEGRAGLIPLLKSCWATSCSEGWAMPEMQSVFIRGSFDLMLL